MNGSLYLISILFCRVVQAICGKRVSLEIKNGKHLAKYTIFYKSAAAVLALGLLIFEGIKVKPGLLSMLIAVLSGLSLFLCQFCGVFALKSGTVSAASMFGTAGLLLPLIFGLVFLNQPIKLLQWLGVLLFFVSAYLLVSNSKNTYSNFSFKTVLLLIGNLLSNGTTMIMQQLYTKVSPEGSISLFSFVSFAAASLFGAIFLFGGNKGKKENAETGEDKPKLTKVLIICALCLAFAVFIINQFATICTGILPPVVLFTIINGGGTIISTVVAAIMYKEKITLKTAIGVAVGIIGLVFVKLFA